MKNVDNQKAIGAFIKKLREKRSLTQGELAKRLNTSQSAIARMERGGQNLSSGELLRIGDALDHKIVTLSDSYDFKIEGGKKLHGKIKTNPSKNGAMGLLCASLINKGKTVLNGIPRIEEVNRMLEIFAEIGVKTRWLKEQTLEIVVPEKINKEGLSHPSVANMRSSLMLIPALAKHLGNFNMLHSGGCKMGERTIGAHRHVFEAFGINIKSLNDRYQITTKLKPANEIVMYEQSDTGAINALICASLFTTKTKILFAPPNYQVREVSYFLEGLGVKIDGIGTHNLEVTGLPIIKKDIEYHNSEDPIESMMFISAGVVTKSELKIERCPIDYLALEMMKLKAMGLKFKFSEEYLSYNQKTKLVDITVYPSKLKALKDKIHAGPYPAINSDNLPFFVPIATVADGTTLIHDWMWENRAIYFTELNRLGANVALADPHRVFVTGPTNLRASQVVCPPALRPAMIILIAMLASPGVSILRNVYSIARGYEDVANRLNSIGAKVSKIT